MNLLTEFTPLFGLLTYLKLKMYSVEQVVTEWLKLLRILGSNIWRSVRDLWLDFIIILINPNEN